MLEFEVVRRGVDRRQVEEWGGKLTGLIEQERRRADQAEQALYRMQLEAKGTPSFSHLGTHVADIIEEAGRSAEKMLVDAADRAQEVVDEAEAEAAEIITAAEAQAGEIQGAARQDAEQLRVQGPGPRRRPVGRPRHSAPRPSGRPATCWRMPGRRPSSSGRRRSERVRRSRAKPGAWRTCGGGPTSSLGGCTATWSRS
jgi:hypothetical protein